MGIVTTTCQENPCQSEPVVIKQASHWPVDRKQGEDPTACSHTLTLKPYRQ